MAKAGVGDILRFLFRKQLAQEAGDRSDGDLLKQFAATREDRPFTVLFERHAPMVMGVCKRILGDFHQAEDSLQATFHILARRAGSVRWRECLGPWLYAVARRVALRARAKRSAQQKLERRLANMPPAATIDDAAWNDLSSVLDEEIGRLPAKYRDPLILTYLESKSRSRVAKELGWPEGTVARRLERARELLRLRLVKRGVSLSAGAIAVVLVEKVAAAPVPTMLAINTIKAATTVVAGKAAGGGFISAQALMLAEETMKGMLFVKAKLVLMVLTVSVALGGAGWAGYKETAKWGQAVSRLMVQAPEVKKQTQPAIEGIVVALDQYGDPLPDGAVARLGSARFRHEGRAVDITYGTDGKSLYALTDSGLVQWDTLTGKERARLSIPAMDGAKFNRIIISPDGKTFAIPGFDAARQVMQIDLWDMQSAKVTRTIPLPKNNGKPGPILQIDFTPDGKCLFCSYVIENIEQNNSYVGAVAIDLASGQVRSSFGSPVEGFQYFDVSPNSKVIAATNPNGGNVLFWEIDTGKKIRATRTVAEGPFAGEIKFSQDGKKVALGFDGQIVIFDSETGKETVKLEKKQIGSVRNLAFFSEGQKLVSYSNSFQKEDGTQVEDGFVRIWDLTTGHLLHSYDGGEKRGIHSMALSLDHKIAAFGTSHSTIHFWDLATYKEMQSEPDAHHMGIRSLFLSPDGNTMFSSSGVEQVRVWETGTWRQKASLAAHGSVVCYSAEGKKLATEVYDEKKDDWNKIILWDVDLGKETLEIPIEGSFHKSFFSGDGSKLYTLDEACMGEKDCVQTLRHWSVATGKQEQEWKVPSLSTRPFLLPDGKTVMGRLDDGAISIYDVVTRRTRLRPGHTNEWILTNSLSPDGSVFASRVNEPNPEIRLWEVVTGKGLFTLRGNQEAIPNVAWAPYGRMLATGDIRTNSNKPILSQSVRLWDTSAGKQIAEFKDIKADVSSLVFSPNGKYLIAGLRDGTILVFDVSKYNPNRPNLKLSDGELQINWGALTSDDAAKAQKSLWTFVSAPKQSIPFLRDHLKPVALADQEKIQQWITELGSATFAERQSATKQLEKIGAQIQVPIQAALKRDLPLETRRRLEQILNDLLDVPRSETMRTVRAIMALERIGTAEAQGVLETLARGAPGARETEEARVSLERLTRKSYQAP